MTEFITDKNPAVQHTQRLETISKQKEDKKEDKDEEKGRQKPGRNPRKSMLEDDDVKVEKVDDAKEPEKGEIPKRGCSFPLP